MPEINIMFYVNCTSKNKKDKTKSLTQFPFPKFSDLLSVLTCLLPCSQNNLGASVSLCFGIQVPHSYKQVFICVFFPLYSFKPGILIYSCFPSMSDGCTVNMTYKMS